MDIREAYNLWSSQYDSNENKTRDLEAKALREILGGIVFESCLEAGCGTGKNTEWLAEHAKRVTSVDLSEEMLAIARNKISPSSVEFIQCDITQPWKFMSRPYDLVSFSLVLEHIEDLDFMFSKVAAALNNNGYLYVGELHPFKQYMGSKARFESDEGINVVTCYKHHISDFMYAARKNHLRLVELKEYFDDQEKEGIPRILALLFRKEMG